MKRAAVILLGLGGALLALLAVGRPRLLAAELGVMFCLLCGVVVWRIGFTNGRRELFSPVVLLTAYMLLGFGVRGLTTVAGASNKIEGALDPTSPAFFHLYAQVFFYCIVGVLALLFGDAIGRRWKPRPVIASDQAGDGRLAMLAGVALGLFGAVVLIGKLGVRLLTDPAYVATAGPAGLFWIYPLLSAPMYGFAYRIALSYRRGEPTPRWVVAALLLAGLVVYLLTSSKAAILNSVVLLLVTRHVLVGPVRVRTLILPTLAFVIVLPLFYLHRAYGLTPALVQRLDPTMLLTGFGILLNRSYLADSFAAVIHYTPQPYDYMLGRTWLELFYFWVPRGIWPDKPLSYSLTFAQTYLSSLDESHGSFFSPTLLGDAYQNFGPLGVPVLMLVLGLALRLWYDRCTTRGSVMGAVVFAASLYWIAVAPEQSLQVILELAISYVAIAWLITLIGRRASWWPFGSGPSVPGTVSGRGAAA
jgi:oligosaccharide repeat unit polymerase